MKTQILTGLLTISLVIISCDPPKSEEDMNLANEDKIRTLNISQDQIEMTIIDECQYIIYKENKGTNLGYGFMSHKGNCNNPVHSDKLNLSRSDISQNASEQLISNNN